jgi:hypothetical protein
MSNRIHKMGRRGLRKCFNIKVNMIECAQCGKQVSKKQTNAVQVKTQPAYNKSKEVSMRKSKPTDNSAPRPRAGTPVVTFVRRVCREGCK